MNQKIITVDRLLEELKEAGIKLWSDRGQLRYRAPKSALTPDLKQQLQQHKAAILSSLTPADPSTQLDLGGFFAQPTLAQLHQVVSGSILPEAKPSIGQKATTEELAAEAESIFDLDVDLTLERLPILPNAVLLTGGTGFLGVYLLYELLLQTSADIYCLVRAKDTTTARQRLKEKLKEYQLWQDKFASRIVPLPGDLAKPRLGLARSQYEQLCQAIDVIYHNGALVNFVYPYTALKAPNVLGTQEILKIATTNKIKPLHYISTIGVFLSVDGGDKIIYETDRLETGETLEGGYAQSKWVAEKLVSLAREKGLPANIYRPGTITGHSITGFCSTQDWLSLMLGSCLHLGMMPEMNTEISFTPVDYVSRGIVNLSQQNSFKANNNYYHLVSPHFCPWNQLPNLLESLDYSLQRVGFEKWLQAIDAQTEDSSISSLKNLLPSLQAHGNSGNVRFDSENAIARLSQQGLQCPDSILQLLKSQLSYLRKQELTIS